MGQGRFVTCISRSHPWATHPPHVGLEDLLLPAAHVNALLVHVQRRLQLVYEVQRLRQVEDYSRVVWLPLMLCGQQRQVQLHRQDYQILQAVPSTHPLRFTLGRHIPVVRQGTMANGTLPS